MMRTFLISPVVGACVVLLFPFLRAEARTKADPHLIHSYQHLPLPFEANQGQSDPSVRFLSRVNNATIFLTADEAVVRSTDTVVRMHLQGANHAAVVQGQRPLASRIHYCTRAVHNLRRAVN